MNDANITPRFKKGDAFVQEATRSLVFMEINEVEKSSEYMDFCLVTWYMLDVKGLNVQRRFSMAARDGKFSSFAPVPRKTLKETKSLMRQFDAEVKQTTTQKEGKRLCK